MKIWSSGGITLHIRIRRRRRRRKKTREMDVISDLPLDVLEPILMHLPIRDAMRTSILSRKWRYRWTTIPELVFDDECISISWFNRDRSRNKLVNVVDRALLLHKGPVQKFKLSVSFALTCADIDAWITYLSGSNIKEFSLEFQERDWYRVPSSLFKCQFLTQLELFHCEFLPPTTFNGFKNLKSLSLHQPFFQGDVIANFIANCPVLESLKLTDYDTLGLKIYSPRLKFLYLEGEFQDLWIENSPLLTSISITLYMSGALAKNLHKVMTCNMMNTLGGVPLVERLVAGTYFVKYLSVGYLPSIFPTKYNHLRQIELSQVGFEDADQIAIVICLMVNSPNLEHLLISATSVDDPYAPSADIGFWETRHALDCSFNLLSTVQMTNISGVSNEVEFVKFILAKSPTLKKMRIKSGVCVTEEGCDMVKELLQSSQWLLLMPESHTF